MANASAAQSLSTRYELLDVLRDSGDHVGKRRRSGCFKGIAYDPNLEASRLTSLDTISGYFYQYIVSVVAKTAARQLNAPLRGYGMSGFNPEIQDEAEIAVAAGGVIRGNARVLDVIDRRNPVKQDKEGLVNDVVKTMLASPGVTGKYRRYIVGVITGVVKERMAGELAKRELGGFMPELSDANISGFVNAAIDGNAAILGKVKRGESIKGDRDTLVGSVLDKILANDDVIKQYRDYVVGVMTEEVIVGLEVANQLLQDQQGVLAYSSQEVKAVLEGLLCGDSSSSKITAVVPFPETERARIRGLAIGQLANPGFQQERLKSYLKEFVAARSGGSNIESTSSGGEGGAAASAAANYESTMMMTVEVDRTPATQGVVISIKYDSETKEVCLSSVLGHMGVGDQTANYKTMLGANAMPEVYGRMMIGLSGEDSGVVVSDRKSFSIMNETDLGTWLLNFMNSCGCMKADFSSMFTETS